MSGGLMGQTMDNTFDYMATDRMAQSQEIQSRMAADAERYKAHEESEANKWDAYYGAQSNVVGYKHRSADNRISEAERTKRYLNELKYKGNRDVVDATRSLYMAQGRNETDKYISRLGAEVDNYRTWQDNLTSRHRTASGSLLKSREIDLKAGTLKWLQTGKYAGDAFYNTDTTNNLRTQLADLSAAGSQPMTAGTNRRIQQVMDRSQRTAAMVDITNTAAADNPNFSTPASTTSGNSGMNNQGTPPTDSTSDSPPVTGSTGTNSDPNYSNPSNTSTTPRVARRPGGRSNATLDQRWS